MRIVIALILLVATATQAQSITTLPFSQSAICPRDSIDVRFDATGKFEDNNIFQVQVSNVLGTFTSFKTLGMMKGQTSGSIRVQIPYDMGGSESYRFRVIGTSPYVAGTDNGSDIFIPRFLSYHMGSQPYVGLVGDTFTVMVQKDHQTVTEPYQYTWDLDEGAVSIGSLGNPIKVTYKTPGKKLIKASTFFGVGCTLTMANQVRVANCFPKIPNSARIIDPDTSYGPRSGHTWVRVGASYRGEPNEIIYAEAGSTITEGNSASIIYLKPGAQLLRSDEDFVVYAEGASPGSGYSVVKCPSLEFDYSEAPTPEQYAHVAAFSPELCINKIGDKIEVSSTNAFVRSIQLYDLLGRLMIRSDGSNSINTSELIPGKYIIRVTLGGSTISKAIYLD